MRHGTHKVSFGWYTMQGSGVLMNTIQKAQLEFKQQPLAQAYQHLKSLMMAVLPSLLTIPKFTSKTMQVIRLQH